VQAVVHGAAAAEARGRQLAVDRAAADGLAVAHARRAVEVRLNHTLEISRFRGFEVSRFRP